MGNPRAVLISLIMAFLAVLLIWFYVKQKEETTLGLATPKKVVVANQDIAELTTLDETMLRIDSVPQTYIQPGTYSEAKDVVGLITTVPIKKGEQILQNKVLFEETQTKLSTRVSKGKRAITVPVTDIHGAGRLVKPGDRVDILSSIDYGQGDREQREVKTVLQDVLVIATGRNIIASIPTEITKDPISGKEVKRDLRKDTRYTTATLEVTLEEAQGVVFLLTSGEGSIFLALRNPDDRSIEKLYTTDADKVLGERSSKGVRQKMEEGIKGRREPRWLEFRGTDVTPVY
ncbi:MAG TPA: Flp pilus assembly protein CpaB [Deltaproteobacteria bacterium]|nr:Flp pilus assembly protein CpaB [Deltaproteobacteria bacterium]